MVSSGHHHPPCNEVVQCGRDLRVGKLSKIRRQADASQQLPFLRSSVTLHHLITWALIDCFAPSPRLLARSLCSRLALGVSLSPPTVPDLPFRFCVCVCLRSPAFPVLASPCSGSSQGRGCPSEIHHPAHVAMPSRHLRRVPSPPCSLSEGSRPFGCVASRAALLPLFARTSRRVPPTLH